MSPSPPPSGSTPAPAGDPARTPQRVRALLAFAAVYFIWGSTYLAIRIAIETIPPFLMAGARFLVAGTALYGWARAIGAPRATRTEWRSAAVVGILLLIGGNGAVVWAEQYIPSGLAALLVAVVPLWMVLLDWTVGGGGRPGPWLVFGLLWGFGGVALLVGAEGIGDGGPRALAGGLVVLAGSFSWALGSIRSRRSDLPASPRESTAIQMLVGGALFVVLGVATGEGGRLDPEAVSARSLLALAYLVVFGAVVAYSAYIWLLRNVSAARASTYAYVNPVVALALGWALAGEPVTRRTLLAAFVIVTAVMIISVRGSGRRAAVARGPAAGD